MAMKLCIFIASALWLKVRELNGLFVPKSKSEEEKEATPKMSSLGYGVFQVAQDL